MIFYLSIEKGKESMTYCYKNEKFDLHKKNQKNLKRIQGDKALLRKVTKEQTRKFTKVLDKE